MDPTDLTVKILQEIREELRGQRTDNQREFGLVRQQLRVIREAFGRVPTDFSARFEVVLATLRELTGKLADLEKREPH